MEGLNRGYFNVLKSAMVGSVYYAAVEAVKRKATDESGNEVIEDIPENERGVWAAVFLTRVDRHDYFNFAYKDMDETVLPYYYQCPKSILNLLSATENEYAIQWRQNCLEYHAKKTAPNALGKLPVGSIIECVIGGDRTRLTKFAPAYQFKRPFWMCSDGRHYVKAKDIPEKYEVVRRGWAK